ncbi:hypothetical protein ACQI4L_19770 [Mycolicibacterium litorale]|uniref:hypothetical protein n=1 Tax=Mycolicibacterium litorale TaxID=758802 RepID=UPI003CEFB2D2
MTVYALDLDAVHATIRDTLVTRVLPGVESDNARAELMAVVEMLDSLEGRLAWERTSLAATVDRTRTLGAALGQDSDDSDDLQTLRTSRRSIGEALSAAYADGVDPTVIEAVARFTADDIVAEISPALRPGLPG